MGSIARSIVGTQVFFNSETFKRGVSSLTQNALVRLDVTQGRLGLTTRPSTDMPRAGRDGLRPEGVQTAPGSLSRVRRLNSDDPDAGWLAKMVPASGNWVIFEFLFESGTIDHVALQLEGGEHDADCETVLTAIWPVLREDCLQELLDQPSSAASDALLWMISKNVGAAILVLDPAGRVVQANQAGAALLKGGCPLKETSDGLQSVSQAETKALRTAIRECLKQEPGTNVEMILFLEVVKGYGRVPLSLSCYDNGTGNPMIVAMMPQKPDPKRIEMLAQKMGLTPAEARVAALMQLGLSNREASYIAQVKEQTFNTYAKRVLAKLNVSCRAEMAQLLTWQAGLGRAS